MEYDISVLVCTRNRAESLRETLDCLARADRAGLRVEIVVVDNGSTDATQQVAGNFRGLIDMRLLFEPRQGVFGKSHALNCALDEGGLGGIVAVLDDDMTPHSDWFHGIAALSKRWPDKDLFSGRTYVIWPADPPPEIAQSTALRVWMYSIMDEPTEDQPMGNGRFFAGGHFWFRSRCLRSGVRFDDVWLTEPKFMLDLVELGHGAVSGPDAVAGHRIQKHLLEKDVIRERARKVGESNAEVRLRPYRSSVKHARFMKSHPLVGRLFCVAKVAMSAGQWIRAQLITHPEKRFVRSVTVMESLVYHMQLLRIANQMPEYRIVGYRRRSDSPP
jgi:glycosyltransferase involved in cell wall biosynthesis